jgi:hypothetical protein
MTSRFTTRWLNTFMNAHKHSSFQDKMMTLRNEPNPYYLLEWLVIEQLEDDSDMLFWDRFTNERTPSKELGTLLAWEPCIRNWLLLELCLGIQLDEEQRTYLVLSFADLQEHYGLQRWQQGIITLKQRIELTLVQDDIFRGECSHEIQMLDQQYQHEWKQIQQDYSENEEDGIDLATEKRKLVMKYERRKQEMPKKIIKKHFPENHLLYYLVISNSPYAQQRLKHLMNILDSFELSLPIQWRQLAMQNNMTRLTAEWSQHDLCKPEWSSWFHAWMSRSDLTRSAIDVEERQRQGLRWMSEMITYSPSDDQLQWWFEQAFRAKGWEERLVEAEFNRELLHQFVWFARSNPERCRRIREEVLLKHWPLFISRLVADEEHKFEEVSWVLMLESENIQHRLLRYESMIWTTEQVIRKLCQIFSEAIRRGLNEALLVSLFAYLAKHDKEAFYTFVHGMKSLNEILLLMDLPSAMLIQLFRGDGIRQEAARKQLLNHFYTYIESGLTESVEDYHKERLKKLSAILSYDKRAAVNGWLHRHEHHWRQWLQRGEGEYSFTRLLQFRWIGTTGEPLEQHKTVHEWLQRHSDWVQFETDFSQSREGNYQYRIVKPGAIDAETGELLCRMTVRAEWTNIEAAKQWLDDLRSL